MRLSSGGKFDTFKAYSPDIIRKDNSYILYYVGVCVPPSERRGYRLLAAVSQNGKDFEKVETPIIDVENPAYRQYSPEVFQHGNKYILFYGLNTDGSYRITSAISKDGLNFSSSKKIHIDLNKDCTFSVHTPRMIVDDAGTIHCYYTGSCDAKKIFPLKQFSCTFCSGYKLLHTTSKDGKNFSTPNLLNIDSAPFINTYGHEVYYQNGITYLFFSGFDGRHCRIYFTYSFDSIHFMKPQIVVNNNPQEIGIYSYSCSLLPLSNNSFRLFYSKGTDDTYWDIQSVKFSILAK